MQTYSAKVRLGGSLYNEVLKHDLTAPEILLLQSIHNSPEGEGVVDIKPTGRDAYDTVFADDDPDHRAPKKVLRTERAERERLKNTYDPTGKKMAKIFGVGNPLPMHIEGVAGVVTPEAPARRQRKAAEPAPEPEAELAGMT